LHKRIKSWEINGKPLDLTKKYWAVSTGGKMQNMNAADKGLTKFNASDVIAEYIRNHKTIKSIKTEDVIYRHSRTAG
jgi:hypothetical protein